jgi:hypothetical protein
MPGSLAQGEGDDHGRAGDGGEPEPGRRPLAGKSDPGDGGRQRHDAENYPAVRGADALHGKGRESRKAGHKKQRDQGQLREHPPIRNGPAPDEQDGRGEKPGEGRPGRRHEPRIEALERQPG